MDFQTFRFHPRVAAGITAQGYTTPTPIQAEAIPPVLEGRDVMGLAQTGTGKTAAFALPILNRLIDGPRGVTRALVVAPTRELAQQIHDSITALGAKTGLKSVTLYGGVGIGGQIQKLKAGADIIVACPGRLLDHLGQRNVDLSRLEVLVLDEADQMFDMGFLPDIRRILRHVPTQRQTLLFSATMPASIRGLADETLKNPVVIRIGTDAPVSTVAHALYPVEQHLKTPLLMKLLEHTDTESVLVFTRTKHRAKRLAQQLTDIGHKAACLQGNLSQNRRQDALDGFRDGSYQILVATDIAARGIDVSSISHVVNYDIPSTAEAYTHRIGRTGRAAKTGDAFTFVSREDEPMVRSIERVMNARIERRSLPDFNYNVTAPPRQEQPARQPRRQESGGSRNAAPRNATSAAPVHSGDRPQAASGGQRSGGSPSGVSPWSQARRQRNGR